MYLYHRDTENIQTFMEIPESATQTRLKADKWRGH